MEVKNIKIKGISHDEFKDNEYLEKYVEELRANGVGVVTGVLDDIINWGRSNSLWPLTFATSCCGIEFMSVGAARYDFAREESNLYIEQELAELKNNVRQSETQFKWKVKKNLFIRREELVEGLFEKLRIKLIDYSKTEAYQTKLINLINQTIQAEGMTSGVLLVKEGECEFFAKALKSHPNLKVECSNLIEVGGFILQESNGKMAIEMTLDHQLKVQKEWFFAHSELHF